jgi:hypothetical protein
LRGSSNFRIGWEFGAQELEEGEKIGGIGRRNNVSGVALLTRVLPIDVDAVQAVQGIRINDIGNEDVSIGVSGYSRREMPLGKIRR